MTHIADASLLAAMFGIFGVGGSSFATPVLGLLNARARTSATSCWTPPS